ncbi:MAG TPA: FAD-dependent oxidoreductase [Caldilineaceae bacterium]|nr:FAD-dependent oxidoreductase [Caldilineaceae bacterium]
MGDAETMPVIMLVDDDETALRRVETELRKRYSPDYTVQAASSADAALETLARLDQEGRQVALVLCDQWMPTMTGVEFLTRVHDLHPLAQRILLIERGDRASNAAILRGAALGRIDDYAFKPLASPDEGFHTVITGDLDHWARQHRPQFELVRLVGEQWSARSHEFRDLLDRNGVPYGFYDVESEQGRELLRQAGCSAERLPVVVLQNNAVLVDPSPEAVADALGVSPRPEAAVYDLTIVGAGPAGLSAAVYGASEGLKTIVVECEAIGGQAGASSMIRNYLGFPHGISGAELAGRAYEQAWRLGAHFYFMRRAAELRPQRIAGQQHYCLVLSDGTEIRSRTVALAVGVAYRHLGIPRLEALVGRGVFYGAAVTEDQAMEGQEVFVVGGGNSAGQAAVHLSRYARRVTLVTRGESLAESMSDYLIQELANCPEVVVRAQTEVVDCLGTNRLQGLVLRNRMTGETETVEAAGVFILIGAEPNTGWLPPELQRDPRGYILTGRDLIQETGPSWTQSRPPLLLETSLPGVFAVGDVRYRAVKRVASAVGEGSIVIPLIHEYLSEHYTK